MISVILGVYNDEDYIKEAIQSILNQSYKNFELILTNDGSIDNTPKILTEFKDKRIRLYYNNVSLGTSRVRNTGIKLAKGKYVFFADSDCIYDKNWGLS